MTGLEVILWTTVIIVASAFFVAVEFSLMAARQHRLEAAAATSAAGRAALRNSAELTVLLAGSQLGITVCTLALGAITKPAVHHALTPLVELTGMPYAVADLVSFVLALVIVTFLHLVVGEMAPKSWAIAHPERSAILLSLPMRAFMVPVRPILVAMNAAANWLVHKVGADPAAGLAAGHDAGSLLHLVEHSANVGALDALYRSSMMSALELRELRVADLLPERQDLAEVPADATVAAVQDATRATGHLRVLLREDGRTVGVVHVRDTLAEADPTRPARPLAREPLVADASAPLSSVLAQMREGHQLALVTEGGTERGVVTVRDILPRLVPSASGGPPAPSRP